MTHFCKDVERFLQEKFLTESLEKLDIFWMEKASCTLKMNTYFKLFGFEGTPFYLPKFVTDRIFVSNLC